MITRLAIFEGKVREGRTTEFRAAVIERLYPIWKDFPGNEGVRINFTDYTDEGVPAFPLILAIDYPSFDAMEAALATSIRQRSKDMTAEVMAEFFDGRIHHHVTSLSRFPAVDSPAE